MMPMLPPSLPQRHAPAGDTEAAREHEREAEIRRLKRQATYRRSTMRMAISVGFDTYLAIGLAVYRSVWSLGLLLLSVALTAWTLRARREFAADHP
jgi:hypothetical protein